MRKKIVTRESDLKVPCVETTVGDAQEVCKDLMDTIRGINGINGGRNKGAAGLAANQIGSNLRVCVIKCGMLYRMMINPEIIEKSEETIEHYEGCLSRPSPLLPILVKRHVAVTVKYLNPYGVEKEYKAKNFDAAVVQHELDHLEGILI